MAHQGTISADPGDAGTPWAPRAGGSVILSSLPVVGIPAVLICGALGAGTGPIWSIMFGVRLLFCPGTVAYTLSFVREHLRSSPTD